MAYEFLLAGDTVAEVPDSCLELGFFKHGLQATILAGSGFGFPPVRRRLGWHRADAIRIVAGDHGIDPFRGLEVTGPVCLDVPAGGLRDERQFVTD